MKKFIHISTFILFTGLMSSCIKDEVKKENNLLRFIPTSSWTGRETVHCEDQNSFEYDLIEMLHEKQLPGVDTILYTELGSSAYEDVKDQILIAFDIGLEAWYIQYVGT